MTPMDDADDQLHVSSVPNVTPGAHGKRPKIGIALYGDLTFDSRVRRETATLADSGFDVVVVCLAGVPSTAESDLPASVRVIVTRPDGNDVLPGSTNPFKVTPLGRLQALRERVGWLWSYSRNLRAWGRTVPAAAGEVDAWHLNDFVALAAVAPRLASGIPVVYDAHDLFLETGTALRLPWFARRLLQWYERHLVSRVAAVITVNVAVAKVLHARYHPARLEIIHNCPERPSPRTDRPTLIRDATGIPSAAPVILHHGRLGAQRGIEQLMAALLEPGLESAHLVLMGFGEKRLDYRTEGQDPRYGGRVHVLDAVSPSILLDWVASADIGAMPIQASTMNLYLSTPNKLFESLAAGIPVVASDFPAISAIVLDRERGPLGAVCEPSSPTSIAAALRSILELDLESREALRERCHSAAQTRWNWQTEGATLTRLYRDLTDPA